jgi:hypothetical protein
MKHIFLVGFVGFSSLLFGQKYAIQWGEMQKSSGKVISILSRSGSDFSTLRWSGGALLGSYRLINHDNFIAVANEKLKLLAEGSMANLEDVKMIGEKLVVFMSDRKDGENHFFMQEFGMDMLPKGPAVELAKYTLEKGRSRGAFNIITSRDNNFFGVIWEVPGKKEISDRYGFKIFDSELLEVSEGDYKLPYEGQNSSIIQHYLSNTGDYFISLIEYTDSKDKKVYRSYLNYKALHILHITPDDLEDFTVDLKGKRIEALSMNSDNNRIFTITGIYGEENQAGVSGLIYLRADFDKQEIIDEGIEKFGKDFITQGWSDKQKQRAEKKEQRGKGEPQLYNYVMRQTEVLEDGSIVGSLEQYYVVITQYTDPKTGAVRTTYTYHYNDIIAFKVGVDGGFDWLKKINKSQISTNDGGALSSYARFVDNGNLCFIFNDHVKNYDEKGDYLNDEEGYYPANFGKKKNVVALVKIDIESGDIKRSTFFDRKEITAVAVPKLFHLDYNTKELLLYSVYGSKERFGLLKLDN